ncbi:MAG: hypothetical protein LBB65_02550 [Burkholderiales bacterium]|jgi:hypothetical protein|nr:hypothetical protein [Burkholderiales bacterium]
MLGHLIQLYNDFGAFRKQYTDARAARLDNLDALISSLQSATVALNQHQALLAGLKNVAGGYQCKIIDTPGAGSFKFPGGTTAGWLSSCGGDSGGGSSYGGGAAAIVRLPIINTGAVISFNIGAGGSSPYNINLSGTQSQAGTAGGATTVAGFTVPGGGAGTFYYNNGSTYTVHGAGGVWAGTNNWHYISSSASNNGAMRGAGLQLFSLLRMGGFFANGTNGNSHTAITPASGFPILATQGLGISALQGLGANGNAGRGGMTNMTTETPAGNGLVMFEWWGNAE